MPVISESGAAPTGGECLMAQSLEQLKVHFFVVLYNNFVISLHHHIMSSTYQVTENYISDAIDALHRGDYSNPIATAQAFGVNVKTVQQKLQGRVSKSLRLPTNKVLNLEQKQALKDYIQRLDKHNVSAKVSKICAAANYILKKSHSNPLEISPQVSKKWTKQFLNRHPQFHKKKQKPLVVERKNAHNKEDF